MAEKLNLYQKIVKVRESVCGLSKDKDSYDYSYVSGNQILKAVKETMNEYNLLLVPSSRAGEWTTYDYTTSKGKEKTDFVVWGSMQYVWIDGDTGESLPVEWAYYGQQDDISKAYGSALTYSERYFWLKVLGLPTDDDDPDGRDTSDRSGKSNKGQPAPSSEAGYDKSKDNRPITDGQVKLIYGRAKGNKELVEYVLQEKDITNPEDVKRNELDEVLKLIEAYSMAKDELKQENGGESADIIYSDQSQRNSMQSLAKTLNYDNKEMQRLINERYGKGNSKQLTKNEADNFIKYLEKKVKEVIIEELDNIPADDLGFGDSA